MEVAFVKSKFGVVQEHCAIERTLKVVNDGKEKSWVWEPIALFNKASCTQEGSSRQASQCCKSAVVRSLLVVKKTECVMNGEEPK